MKRRPSILPSAAIRFALAALAALAALLGAPAAPAADNAPPVAACQSCHGRAGVSSIPGIPNLAGQQEAYLAKQLTAFRSGDRRNPLMAAIAGQLDDADIASFARYWSRVPAIAPADAGSAPRAATVGSRMRFPANFPGGFAEYERAAVDGAAAPQVVLRYANDEVWKAVREQRAPGDGATLIVATHAVLMDAQHRALRDADGVPLPGPLLSYSAMQLRAGRGADFPALLRNGDWEYAQFDAAGLPRAELNQAPCLACHRPKAADDYVFTMPSLRAAVARTLEPGSGLPTRSTD